MTEQNIIDAYCLIRKINNTIPDDVLNFMKNAAIEKLNNKSEKTIYQVVSILNPEFDIIYEGSYEECVVVKNKKGFGYCMKLKN